MCPISRKAVLISYPGVEGKDNYCPGVFSDIENYCAFLQSPLGGAWRWNRYSENISEIRIFPSPRKTELVSFLRDIRACDYVIIAFCGHGGYSQRNQQTQIELNDNEKMIESELHAIGIRENIILDCCRVLLPGIIADAMENFGLRRTASATERRNLNKDECRRFYDKRISECSSGINVLYGCNILEKSGESTSGGGYYSSSLRKVANAWEDDKNRSLPSDKYVILSVPDAHNRAIPLVNNKKSNQNPQIIVNNGDLFPWAIASY